MRAHARKLGHRASTNERRRVCLAGGTTILALLLMAVFAGVAQASSVSTPTVNNTSPSPAAGAKTVYTVAFTTSANGALSAAVNDQITIGFPATTDLSGLVGSSVKVAGNNSSIGSCFHASGTQNAVCQLGTGQTIAPNTAVTIEIDGVINPTSVNGAGSGFTTLSVFTTKDADPSTSGRFQIQAVQQLSVTSVTDTPPSAAAGAKTIYTVGFTTTSTGGLAAAALSQITIGFPATTDLTRASSALRSRCAGNNVRSATAFRERHPKRRLHPAPDRRSDLTGRHVEIDGVVNATSNNRFQHITVDTTSPPTLQAPTPSRSSAHSRCR